MYPIHVDLITIREGRIAQLSAESADSLLEPKYLNGTTKLKLIELPIDMLLYRLENYRTGNRQKTLVSHDPSKAGLFDLENSEDVATQRAQHELLIVLAKEGQGEHSTDIYGELKRVGRQTEPLTITATGIVANGNRRLSAMRELLDEVSSFSHVQCAVLPASATPEDIRDLEFRLQMQPDTKLPYDWTALGRGVLDMRKDNYSDDKIEMIMNRDKKELARSVSMVNAADRYLSEWLGTSDDFDALDETEQAFKQIAVKNRPRADDAPLREATLAADFFLIENRGRLDDRAYNYINIIEENAEQVLANLADAFDIPLVDAVSTSQQDEFDFPSVPGVVRLDYAPVAVRLKKLRENEEHTKAAVDKLMEICLSVSQQNKGREKAALNFARAALKQLSAVDMSTAGPSTYAELQGILDNVAQKAEQLRAQLDEVVTAVGI